METIIAKIRQQAMDMDICYIEDKQAYQFISELQGEAIGSFKTGHDMAKCLLQQARINGGDPYHQPPGAGLLPGGGWRRRKNVCVQRSGAAL